MGRWDQELIELLPESVRVYASAGAGFDWIDTACLADYGEWIPEIRRMGWLEPGKYERVFRQARCAIFSIGCNHLFPWEWLAFLKESPAFFSSGLFHAALFHACQRRQKE